MKKRAGTTESNYTRERKKKGKVEKMSDSRKHNQSNLNSEMDPPPVSFTHIKLTVRHALKFMKPDADKVKMLMEFFHRNKIVRYMIERS